MYVGLIRWLRLLPSLGLYMGVVQLVMLFMFLWSCAYRRLARLCSWASGGQRAHEKKREPRRRAEGGQEEARRRAGEDQEGVRKRAPTIQIPKFFYVVSHFNLEDGVVRGLIPRLYTGLYVTPGPLLAAPSDPSVRPYSSGPGSRPEAPASRLEAPPEAPKPSIGAREPSRAVASVPEPPELSRGAREPSRAVQGAREPPEPSRARGAQRR